MAISTKNLTELCIAQLRRANGTTGDALRQIKGTKKKPTHYGLTRLAERHGFIYDAFWGPDNKIRYRFLDAEPVAPVTKSRVAKKPPVVEAVPAATKRDARKTAKKIKASPAKNKG